MKARLEYNLLKENGELLEMYPELSGSWSKDKESFTEIWEQNMEAINGIESEFDDYDEYY